MTNNMPLQKLIDKLLKSVPPRFKEVVCRRYGIGTEVCTLESIGKKMGITRERVRQIEEAALKKLAAPANKELIDPIIDWTRGHLGSCGGIKSEKVFLQEVARSLFPNTNETKAKNFISLVLAVSEKFNFMPENKEMESGWYLQGDDKERALQFLKYIEKEVKSGDKPMPQSDFGVLIREASAKHNIASESVAASYLNLSKKFGLNILNEFGLNSWPEINPRGVREKAYLVFRQEKQPLHFVQLAKIINNTPQWQKKVHYQTIHNELIKDSRFVLIGRGMYALKEWGYEPGTVLDVLKRILSQKGTMPAGDIISLVKEQRIIKENTILLNLQNRNYFIRQADGSYGLKKGAGKKAYPIQEA